MNLFYLIKAFAAGVILATGFIHVLPDAFEDLTSPCLNENPWGKFPFTGFIAMFAAIGTLMIDSHVTSFYNKSDMSSEPQTTVAVGDLEETVGNQMDGTVGMEPTLIRHRMVSQVLEVGVVVHSVIIGISLGASESPKTIKPLVAALTFHQFFEGMGLGGCITQAKFKFRAVAVMAMFFSLTTPLGVCIGLGVTNSYDENSTKALIVEGSFNAASAGILIYMALVDLLAVDFMGPRLQNNGKLRLGANASLLLGAGCMSLLAK